MSIQQQQLINLFLLLLLGSFFSNVYLSWWEMGIVLLFTFVFDVTVGCRPRLHRQNKYQQLNLFQMFLTRCSRGLRPTIPFSSLSTAIGVMLMMVSTHLYIYLIVIALALLQKHYLQINGQHFFNPSNFALIMALLLFYDDAHIVLGQLGDEYWLALILGLLAIIILIRVNRWLISLFFTLFYLLFQYLFVVGFDPMLIMDEVYHRFFSISFILFILFMLTDPRTTPSKSFLQLIFAFLVALLAVGLDSFYGFRVQHIFLSLFLFSLFTPLVEQWKYKEKKDLMNVTFFLFVLATVAIIFIENQTPYYFTMES